MSSNDANSERPILSRELNRLVFVYGTLKTGFCRNYYLADSKLVGESQTRPDYLMYDFGEYPGLVAVDPGKGKKIHGEVWAVSDLDVEQLDVVEAVEEGLYRRTVIELNDSFDNEVEGYLYCRSLNGLAECGESWSKGFQSPS